MIFIISFARSQGKELKQKKPSNKTWVYLTFLEIIVDMFLFKENIVYSILKNNSIELNGIYVPKIRGKYWI